MKIATFNVNGVNGRLPLLLDWLAEAAPDVACLQELKAPQEKFPQGPIEDEWRRNLGPRVGESERPRAGLEGSGS